MVGVLFFLVIAGLAIRIVYGLRRPHFWVFSGVVILVAALIVLDWPLVEQGLRFGGLL